MLAWHRSFMVQFSCLSSDSRVASPHIKAGAKLKRLIRWRNTEDKLLIYSFFSLLLSVNKKASHMPHGKKKKKKKSWSSVVPTSCLVHGALMRGILFCTLSNMKDPSEKGCSAFWPENLLIRCVPAFWRKAAFMHLVISSRLKKNPDAFHSTFLSMSHHENMGHSLESALAAVKHNLRWNVS